jgi:BRCT domain type II-containing protein
VGSISGKTSFILAGDNMGPSKLQKAEKLGIQIVSEDKFLSMIEGGTSIENNTSVPTTSSGAKPTTPIQLDLFS